MRGMAVRVLLIALLALVGCSSAGPGDGGTADGSASSSEAADASVSTLPSSALPAQVAPADLAAALERLKGTSFRFEVRSRFGGQEIDTDNGLLTRGAFDGTWASSESLGVEDGQETEASMQTVTDGAFGYLFTPGFPHPSGGPLELASEQWIAVDVARIERETGLEFSLSVTAFELFEGFQAIFSNATEIVEGPASSSQGVATRTFSFTVIDPELEESGYGDPEFFVTVHIDADGWIRQVDAGSTQLGQLSQIYDIGEAIAVEVPADAADVTLDFIETAAG